jgi:hypothetical protein
MGWAVPLYLMVAFLLDEEFPLRDLSRDPPFQVQKGNKFLQAPGLPDVKRNVVHHSFLVRTQIPI